MDIYDDVVDALGPYFSTRTADRVVKKATKQAEREGRAITGYRTYTYRRRGKGSQYSSPKYYEVPIFGQSEEERVGPIRAEQQRLAGIQQASYEKQQGDIASQLKIVQEEKSAVSKMMADYSDMLIREAEARKKAQEAFASLLKPLPLLAALAVATSAIPFRLTPPLGMSSCFVK